MDDAPRPVRGVLPLFTSRFALALAAVLVQPHAAPSGKALFTSGGCAGCHTLAAAGAAGVAGPDLDQLAPDAATVATAVKSGPGAMPAFEGQLSTAQIQAVADYVADNAGG